MSNLASKQFSGFAFSLLAVASTFCAANAQVENQSLAYAQAANQQNSTNNHSSFMLNLVNKDRAHYGAAPVQEHPKLEHLAQTYAEYLLRTGMFSHIDEYGRNPQQRASLFGVRAGIAENLAWQASNFESDAILIRRAEESMMAEPPNQLNHRFNILNPRSRFVGIGVAKEGDKIVMVQEFTEEEP